MRTEWALTVEETSKVNKNFDVIRFNDREVNTQRGCIGTRREEPTKLLLPARRQREWGEVDQAILPVKGWPAERFQLISQSVGEYDSTTDLAFGCVRNNRIMSDLMPSLKTGHMMEENTEC
jgi:hypothetical protein